jgi:hypothetical protein
VSPEDHPREIRPVNPVEDDLAFQEDVIENIAKERNESLQVMLNNITELGTIFKDLSILVVE